MRSKETVLVTAAAGGTGQFAVQLAKLAGNTVVATCGSAAKAQLLTDLGCHRVINYNKEQPKARVANHASTVKQTAAAQAMQLKGLVMTFVLRSMQHVSAEVTWSTQPVQQCSSLRLFTAII